MILFNNFLISGF
uniref:Alpha-2-macroglobulin receptor-associated protein n=1 Tax=Triatoma infestans TaxID=30076 RepID=A0A171B2P2_TRIIF